MCSGDPRPECKGEPKYLGSMQEMKDLLSFLQQGIVRAQLAEEKSQSKGREGRQLVSLKAVKRGRLSDQPLHHAQSSSFT